MKNTKKRWGQRILGIVLGVYALCCLLPLILIVIVSFTDDKYLAKTGFSFFPEKWSLAGWKYVLDFGDQLWVSYGVTIFITVAGTVLGLAVMSMFAYALSRRCFMLRNALSIMMLITMLFSGGTLSEYIVNTRYYGMKDNLLVLILPTAISTMYVIILRTYIQTSIPEALIDSAKIDGAGEFRTYLEIILPVMKPSLASVGFMQAINLWNGWQGAYMYISSASKTPLQLLLIRIEKSIEYLLQNDGTGPEVYVDAIADLPQQSGRMAILLTALGPILIAYPFFQKYFIKGMTVGAVKG